MNHETAVGLLSIMADGAHTTRELIGLSGRSPNTVIRYLRELERRGLVERIPARKPGAGRPPIVNRPTPLGMEQVRQGEIAAFHRLRTEADILWGPRRSLSFWGVPFFGRSDIFARRRMRCEPFELVVERNPALYRDPVERADGRYPAAESLVAWASRAAEPRFQGAAAVLLHRPGLHIGRLVEDAGRLGSVERIGYLASVVGADRILRRIPRPRARKGRRPGRGLLDRETARLAARWGLDDPLPVPLVREMVSLYGDR